MKLTNVTIGAVFFIALWLFASCSANRHSLAGREWVSVQSQNTENVEILWTDVYQQAGRTWASGVLKQQGLNTATLKTHIDVQVLDMGGTVCYETQTGDLYVPRRHLGKGPDWTKFKVPLPSELPADARVSMAVHSGPHK